MTDGSDKSLISTQRLNFGKVKMIMEMMFMNFSTIFRWRPLTVRSPQSFWTSSPSRGRRGLKLVWWRGEEFFWRFFSFACALCKTWTVVFKSESWIGISSPSPVQSIIWTRPCLFNVIQCPREGFRLWWSGLRVRLVRVLILILKWLRLITTSMLKGKKNAEFLWFILVLSKNHVFCGNWLVGTFW